MALFFLRLILYVCSIWYDLDYLEENEFKGDYPLSRSAKSSSMWIAQTVKWSSLKWGRWSGLYYLWRMKEISEQRSVVLMFQNFLFYILKCNMIYRQLLLWVEGRKWQIVACNISERRLSTYFNSPFCCRKIHAHTQTRWSMSLWMKTQGEF